MDLIDSTRRYFKFKYNGEPFKFCGIQATEEGEIRFPKLFFGEFKNDWGKLTFKSIEECKQWFEENVMKEFNPMERKDKVLRSVFTKGKKLTPSMWEKIKKFMPDPDVVTDPETQIAVFQAHLANNFVDRDRERFAKEVLKSFAKTIIGKNKLMSHKWGEPGNGKIFGAKIEKMDIEETIEFVGGHPDKKFLEHLQEVEEKDGSICWLVIDYYMPNMTEIQKEAVLNVSTGVWADMSIGFRCPVREDIKSEDGEEILYREYRNGDSLTAEALEASHIGVPAQYGATTTKESSMVKELTEKIAELEKKLNESKAKDRWILIDDIEDDEIKFYCSKIDRLIEEKGLAKAVWSSQYINSLEDNCFAFVEKTGNKDDEGRTIPRSARHLPHHPKGKGAPGTGGTVDLPHLRNALARVSQVKPVTDTVSVTELRDKARKHLIAHAKKLNIGNYEEFTRSIDMANFKLESLGINMTVDPEKLEEDLKAVMEKVESGYQDAVKSLNDEIKTIKQERDDVVTKMNEAQESENTLKAFVDELKSVGGEDLDKDKLQKVFNDAKAYRDALIADTVKFGVLSGIIEEDEVEQKKADYEDMDIKEIEKYLEIFKKTYLKNNPQLRGVLPDNVSDIDDDKEPKNKEDKFVIEEQFMQDI